MRVAARTELRAFAAKPSARRPTLRSPSRDRPPSVRRRPGRSLWRRHASLEAEAEAGDDADESSVVFADEDDVDEFDDFEKELFGEGRREDRSQKLEERVLDLSRVTKVVKGGRRLRFRAVMVVGDGEGSVGVGNASANEIPDACRKAALRAKRNLVTFPLNRYSKTFPNYMEAKFGAAKVMLRPAREGTGVIAGGAMRVVLELAGVKNGYGKILNSNNGMNIAKATVKALSMMRTIKQVAKERGVTLDYLLGKSVDPRDSACPPDEGAMEKASA